MAEISPGPRAPDLAKLRAAVQLRERAIRAALEHHHRVGLSPSQQYARATYDAVEEILIQAGRETAMTQPDDLKDHPAEMHRRIVKAVSLLALVDCAPDAGAHGEACLHRDCVALRVRSILLNGDVL